ncbi:hypothetical protein SAMN05421827_102127 [Pedobacter terrae]|uniref:Uncharacterized protein n=1 Tax=Pedobacter terrae TaxID=405671 RepID=A0A1G7Q1G3_9SPHI|nr:hypothetical protein [Pedobacter terrae]SDF92298.1 hypothetical protein SAMN05421827_102127 [Pedobacter terrae]
MDDQALKELRARVCLKAGLSAVTSWDCKFLSEEISKSTKKMISETTLKRFFGLVAVNYKLSRYTLSILEEYAD